MDNSKKIKTIWLFLTLFFATVFSAQNHTVIIPGTDLNKSFKALIITPNSYKNTSKNYSVVYLLHGYSGNFKTWSRIVPLNKFSDQYNLIFVCPDGDYNSWYVDSPIKKHYKFGTYIGVDIPKWVDAHFRTNARQSGRAIIGSSMGGHGALNAIINHSQTFLIAMSISGVLDITQFPNHWDIQNILGQYSSNYSNWKKFSILTQIEHFKPENNILILDCGLKDFALNTNRMVHKKLNKLGIKHKYIEKNGAHTPEYSRSEFNNHIRQIYELLDK